MEDNLTALEKTTSQEGSEILPEEGAETTQTVYNGYFEDSAVKDRTLSDYAGEWQSVYPYLLDGTLDQVWDYKAKIKGGMTAEEYKAYYDTGYKTDVDQINITDNTMEFVVGDKKEKFTYKYVGYKILTYKKEIVVFVSCLKQRMQMLVTISMFNLATTISPLLKQVTSISILVERAKKNSWKSWKTGRHTTLLV